MIFGAMITGVGIGLVAMAAAIVAGAGLLSAFMTYWLVGCSVTASICVVKALFCKAGMAQTPRSNQSL